MTANVNLNNLINVTNENLKNIAELTQGQDYTPDQLKQIQDLSLAAIQQYAVLVETLRHFQTLNKIKKSTSLPEVTNLFLEASPYPKKLDLSGTDVKELKASDQIEELNLSNCYNLPAEEFLTINKKFPRLKKLILVGTAIASLKGLEGLPLEELDLSNCYHFPRGDFTLFEDLNKRFPCLKKFHLYILCSNEQAGEIELKDLKGLQLEELSLSCSFLTNGFRKVQIYNIFPHIKKLRIRNFCLDSLTRLQRLPLEELEISGEDTTIPAREFLVINQIFPQLKKLKLEHVAIGSLQGLEGLPLEELDLNCFNLPAEEFSTIKEKLPQLKKLTVNGKDFPLTKA